MNSLLLITMLVIGALSHPAIGQQSNGKLLSSEPCPIGVATFPYRIAIFTEPDFQERVKKAQKGIDLYAKEQPEYALAIIADLELSLEVAPGNYPQASPVVRHTFHTLVTKLKAMLLEQSGQFFAASSMYVRWSNLEGHSSQAMKASTRCLVLHQVLGATASMVIEELDILASITHRGKLDRRDPPFDGLFQSLQDINERDMFLIYSYVQVVRKKGELSRRDAGQVDALTALQTVKNFLAGDRVALETYLGNFAKEYIEAARAIRD